MVPFLMDVDLGLTGRDPAITCAPTDRHRPGRRRHRGPRPHRRPRRPGRPVHRAGTSLTASRSYGPWGAVTATSQAPQAGSLGYQFQCTQPRHRPDVPTSALDLFNQLRASGEISVSP